MAGFAKASTTRQSETNNKGVVDEVCAEKDGEYNIGQNVHLTTKALHQMISIGRPGRREFLPQRTPNLGKATSETEGFEHQSLRWIIEAIIVKSTGRLTHGKLQLHVSGHPVDKC